MQAGEQSRGGSTEAAGDARRRHAARQGGRQGKSTAAGRTAAKAANAGGDAGGGAAGKSTRHGNGGRHAAETRSRRRGL